MLRHAPWSPGFEGVSVLDAFAGTGALGLEALSRGAASACFIEQDRAALMALRANIASCGADALCRVFAADACRPPPGIRCGLVFLDPPYGRALVGSALEALRRAGWCAPEAIVVAEFGRADPVPVMETILEERVQGAARLVIWRLPARSGED